MLFPSGRSAAIDGAPQPDAALLDLCADIAHQRKLVGATLERWRAARCGVLREELGKASRELSRLLSRAGKLRATTVPGIYAKAIAVARVERRGRCAGHVIGG
jgi:hypothetical protein